jgi:hypothetical protein
MSKTHQDWEQLTQEWEQSRLSKKEFCKRKGIKLTSFYVMSSKIARSNQSAAQDLVRIVLPTKSVSPPIQERITIRVDHRTAIEVTSIDTLQKVLAMLGVAVCSSI